MIAVIPLPDRFVKQYQGAVCFVDILGVGALTRKKINLGDLDYEAHGAKFSGTRSEHLFCAQPLSRFRECLREVSKRFSAVEVAQLSNCTFIWSSDVPALVDVSRSPCGRARGAAYFAARIAFGEIVEPDKEDRVEVTTINC